MREQTGMAFAAAQSEAPVISIRAVEPKTSEDAMTKEVANENARSVAFLTGQLKGMKRA